MTLAFHKRGLWRPEPDVVSVRAVVTEGPTVVVPPEAEQASLVQELVADARPRTCLRSERLDGTTRRFTAGPF